MLYIGIGSDFIKHFLLFGVKFMPFCSLTMFINNFKGFLLFKHIGDFITYFGNPAADSLQTSFQIIL